MLYYAAVILGALVLIVDNIAGPGKIGWEISVGIIAAIFVIEWVLGYYTERKGVIKKDLYQTIKQNIPGQLKLNEEVWGAVQIPMIEEMAERVLSKTLDKIKNDIVKELKQINETKK
ncbi:unnamed protein product [marine sediment metagenome]|uniref:Uncharacterized protein n=1 Tax=marine sediment metagenome TaxID=412755 RepID=X0ZM43_9ZZZZ